MKDVIQSRDTQENNQGDTAQAYAPLREALEAAYSQASEGKGKERHANAKPFDKQPIIEIARMVGIGYQLGQAMKKAQESKGMVDRGSVQAAQSELLGAINYLAAAWLILKEQTPAEPEQEDTSLTVLSIYDPRILEAMELAHNDYCESMHGIRTPEWNTLDPEMKMSIVSVNLNRLKNEHWRLEHREDPAITYFLERASVYLKGRGVHP